MTGSELSTRKGTKVKAVNVFLVFPALASKALTVLQMGQTEGKSIDGGLLCAHAPKSSSNEWQIKFQIGDGVEQNKKLRRQLNFLSKDETKVIGKRRKTHIVFEHQPHFQPCA